MPNITLAPKNMRLVPETASIPQALKPTPIPEALHPGFVGTSDDGSIRGFKASKSFHETAYAKLQSLNELKTKPLPTMNAAQIATELQIAGKRVKVDIQQLFQSAAVTIDNDIKETKSFIEAIGGFKKEEQAKEIRQVLLSMKPQERVFAIDQALADKDTRFLSAVLEAHPSTVGVSPAFIAGARHRWLMQECPQALKDLDGLTKERARLQDNVVIALNTADEASRGIEEFAPQIEAANVARAAFK